MANNKPKPDKPEHPETPEPKGPPIETEGGGNGPPPPRAWTATTIR